MTFNQFYQNYTYKSDKGTDHHYIEGYYSDEFTNVRFNNLTILEIGIQKGYSLTLFAEWFLNSKLFGIDVIDPQNYSIVNKYKNITCLHKNAYVKETVDLFDDNYFDYIIDDGPHCVDSQMFSVLHWYQKLKPGGKLIIEDILDLNLLLPNLNSINMSYKLLDFRKVRNNPYDILIIFEK